MKEALQVQTELSKHCKAFASLVKKGAVREQILFVNDRAYNNGRDQICSAFEGDLVAANEGTVYFGWNKEEWPEGTSLYTLEPGERIRGYIACSGCDLLPEGFDKRPEMKVNHAYRE